MQSRVLLVHSSRAALEEMGAAVQQAGFLAISRSNPISALDWLDTATPDALVTRVDFGPHEVNGVALARMAKLRRINLPVIFVARRQWEEHTADLGQLLPVPLDQDELIDALSRGLGTMPLFAQTACTRERRIEFPQRARPPARHQ